MPHHAKSPAITRRLVPLATGAALVLIATSVGVARERGRRRQHPHASYDIPVSAAPSVVRNLPVNREAPAPPRLAVREERPKTVARLGPILMAAALVLSGLGIGLVGVAVASQRRVPEPPTTSSAPTVATVRDTWGWEASLRPGVAVRPPAELSSVRPSPVATELLLDRSRPVSLAIPAIDVHSVVNDVGQADDGSLETPQPGPHYNEAAWYRHSPTPGSLGPSILLGHVDSAAEGPSVFFRLGELNAGDRVAITRADKSVAVFRVDFVRRYAKNDFPTDEVYGNIDHAGLRIVTCGGAFDNSSGHYLDNVVVFASLIGPLR